MASEKQCCATCRHDPGCLKRELLVSLCSTQTGHDRRLRRGPNRDLQEGFGCPKWEVKPQ